MYVYMGVDEAYFPDIILKYKFDNWIPELSFRWNGNVISCPHKQHWTITKISLGRHSNKTKSIKRHWKSSYMYT